MLQQQLHGGGQGRGRLGDWVSVLQGDLRPVFGPQAASGHSRFSPGRTLQPKPHAWACCHVDGIGVRQCLPRDRPHISPDCLKLT